MKYYRRKTYVPYPSSKVSKFQAKSISLLATSVRSFPYIDTTDGLSIFNVIVI